MSAGEFNWQADILEGYSVGQLEPHPTDALAVDLLTVVNALNTRTLSLQCRQ